MVATQLRHADDPDRPPQPPYPLHYAKLNRICMQLSPVHAHPRVRDLRSGRALHCRPALLALIRVCRYSENVASRHPNAQSPRAAPSLPSRESVLRCAAPPLRGRALPPLPARPSLPPRPAANQRPAHRHRSLSEHNQPPPPSRIANGQRSQPSTRPGFRTSHRPPVRPVTNAVAFGQLRAQRCRSRLALPGASPTASALPAADLPNTGTPPRKRRPASIAPAEAAPSPVAGDSTSSLPTNAPSHPTRHRPPPMPRPTRRRRNGHRGRRSWPADAPSA